MNACLYRGSPVAVFRAFYGSTCEGLFGIVETNECAPCREDYRLSGYTPDGRPIMGCRACGETYDVPPRVVG